MNSGIQCISNTLVLTDYITSNRFKDEINTENPLGSKGKLVTKFANLVKKIWFDRYQFLIMSNLANNQWHRSLSRRLLVSCTLNSRVTSSMTLRNS